MRVNAKEIKNEFAMATAAELPGAPHCANCGVEIPWRPTLHHGRPYCCGGCAQGGPCYCSYDLTTHVWPLTISDHHPPRLGARSSLTRERS
jgi:hypothetical protein